MARNRLDDLPAAAAFEQEHLSEVDSDDEGSGSGSEKSDSDSPTLSGFTIRNHIATSPDLIQDSIKKPILKGPPTSPKPVLKRPPASTSEGKKDSRAKKSKVDNSEKEKPTIQAKTLLIKRSSLQMKTKENGENVVSGKDEERKIQQPKKAVQEDEREFSEMYPYLWESVKNRYAHTSMVSKDWVVILEASLCDLEKSDLEELERRWKEQILLEGQITLRRNSVLVVENGMVKKLRSRKG